MTDHKAMYDQGVAEMSAGRHMEACVLFDQVLEAWDKGEARADVAAHAATSKAVAFRDYDSPLLAKILFGQASEKFRESDNTEARYAAALADFYLGEMLLKEGDIENAHERFQFISFRCITETEPHLVKLAQVATQREKELDAVVRGEAKADSILTITDFKQLYDEAVALMAQRKLPDAGAKLETILNAHEAGHTGSVRAAYAMAALGIVHWDLGSTDKGAQCFERAYAEFKDDAELEARHVALMARFEHAQKLAKDGGQADLEKAHGLYQTVADAAAKVSNDGTQALGRQAADGASAVKSRLGGAPSAPAVPSPASTPSAPASQAVTYERRRSFVDKGPTIWRFEPNRIIRSQDGNEFAIPHDRIRRLHLNFAPTRPARNRYEAVIESMTGQRETIDNMHFVGVANFEDRSLQYRIAMTMLLSQLKQEGHQVEIVTGKSWGYYIFMAALMAFTLFVVLLTFFVGGLIGIGIKVLLLIFYAPTAWRWFKLNKPQRGTLDNVPEGCLP